MIKILLKLFVMINIGLISMCSLVFANDGSDLYNQSREVEEVAAVPTEALSMRDLLRAGVYEYQNNNFAEALNHFHSAELAGLSNPDLYFNIGNTYFRLNNLPFAIIYYKKALSLNSSHKGANENLNFALSITRDRQLDDDENFISNFVISLVYLYPINTLLIIVLTLLAIIIILIHLQLYFAESDRTILRFVCFVLFFAWLGISCLTISRIMLLHNNNDAVVIDNIVNVYSGPSESFQRLFTIHEGTVLKVQRDENGWSQVSTLTGFSGWVESTSFRRIRE
jgi:tetratricopeptide (TPR) repeat protein